MPLGARPLCFVLMPFGKKVAGGGRVIDFDRVYNLLIAPAVKAAGLEPVRADEEAAGGIIHKPMFERLVLCDYAIADLTTANANVFYELGVRHAAKERSTVLLFAEGHGRLPFDVAQLRAYPYGVSEDGKLENIEEDRKQITEKLSHAIKAADTDSPLWQLLEDYPNIDHEKTDIFRERIEIEKSFKRKLAKAREKGIEAVAEIQVELGDLRLQDAGVIVDLFLSYRAVSGWAEMVDVCDLMDPILANTVLVREQKGFALNRLSRRNEAEELLNELIEERGPSSETNGILGRVYKDIWREAAENGEDLKTEAYLEKAIDTYVDGFEDDWRDAYPGINALTLMKIHGGMEEAYASLRPVVGYALKRKKASGDVDYWDHATDFELAVLDGDEVAARTHAKRMISSLREAWEMQTSLNNLELLRRNWRDAPKWISKIFDELQRVS